MRLFRKKNIVPEKKGMSTDIRQLNLKGGIGEILGYATAGKMKWHQISNSIAWNYYMQVSVIYNAIDIISQSYSVVKPRIYDNQEEKFLTKEDTKVPALQLLELLKSPEQGFSYNELAREIVPNFLVTGDLYFRIKSAHENSIPIEIEVINSQDVSPYEDNIEGKPNRYDISFMGGTEVFLRDHETGRFFNSLRNHELWHIKTFNPSSKIKGFSPLNALYYEIEQFISSSVHNGNIMKNGMRPAGVMTIDPEADLSDEQYQQVKDQIKNFYRGEGNAGNVLVIQGGKEFKELSINNKDMDFATLKKTITEQCYRNLKIPMSLVLSDSMTLDNFKQSVPVLYKMAILPLLDNIMQELNLFLMPRYDDSGRYRLSYNIKDIQALEIDFMSRVLDELKTGLLSRDEGRELIGRDSLNDDRGKEIIFYNSAKLKTNAVDQTLPTKSLSQDEYNSLLRKNNFSEDQITTYMDKYYKNI